MAEYETSLLGRLNRTWKECDRIYHDVARRSGLSDCAFWIMYGLLNAGKPLPQKDMSQSWQYSRQTVASALRQLEGQGLITVRLADGSRRDKVIELTPSGTAFVSRHVAPTAVAEQSALEAMGSDAERFIAMMAVYVDLLDSAIHGETGKAAPSGRTATDQQDAANPNTI